MLALADVEHDRTFRARPDGEVVLVASAERHVRLVGTEVVEECDFREELVNVPRYVVREHHPGPDVGEQARLATRKTGRAVLVVRGSNATRGRRVPIEVVGARGVHEERTKQRARDRQTMRTPHTRESL